MKDKNIYKVSVIVPIYNGEKFLDETIKSILNSDLKELQVVLIDDGSKDKSSEICKSFVKERDNILYIQKENGGIVSARNKGLQAATGEYICFCDQDDLVNVDMYSTLLEQIEINTCDIAFCGTSRYINGESVPLENFRDKVITKEEIEKEIIEPILFYGTDLGANPSERWVGSIWKCMIKRELIINNKILFRRYVDFEDDLLFFLDTVLHAEKICTLSYMGYNWRINLNSETYNWKYISEFDKKYTLFTNDVCQMLLSAECSQSNIDNYKAYQLCSMMEQLVLNEGSNKNPKSFLEKRKYIKDVYTKYDVNRMISFRSHIWKSSIRKKIELALLARKCWVLAYLWVVNYKKFRERAIKGKTWFFIEQKVKKKVGNKKR